jgi:hypothetical protein
MLTPRGLAGLDALPSVRRLDEQLLDLAPRVPSDHPTNGRIALMAMHHPAVKKSVTIDRDVLDRLGADRTRNFSATVNESLRLLAALDAQQALVDEWEAENGPFTEDELRPFLETAMRGQIENTMRAMAEHRAAST